MGRAESEVAVQDLRRLGPGRAKAERISKCHWRGWVVGTRGELGCHLETGVAEDRGRIL